MSLWKKFKAKYLDFERPPRPRTLVVLDAIFIVILLFSYALIQHVIPSHFIASRLASIKAQHTVQEAVATPEPVVVSTPAPKRPEDMTLAEKFADKFTDEVVITDSSYSSPDISVTFSDCEFINEDDEIQHYYVADIYVADIHCLQSYIHQNTEYGMSGDSMINLSRQSGSIAAVNGDYALTTNSGVIIRNGEVIRNSPATSEICLLFEDGTVKCLAASDYDYESLQSKGIWQAWTFGPSLLDPSGKALNEFPSTYGTVLQFNPRSVLGYYEPGHYCFVAVDGRQAGYAIGLDMQETAKLMEDLGCKVAFNLDGGRSTQMTFFDTLINDPYKQGRYVGDIILIKEPGGESE